MSIEKNLIYPKYVYFVRYCPNCEESYLLYLSLSKKRCKHFILSHTFSSYQEYWNYYGSRTMYKSGDLILKKVKLDSFRKYR